MPEPSLSLPLASLPVLYTFRRCPYAMRARLALAVSQQRCEWREVSLKAKPAEMLAASPKATVPVLVLPDGQVIDQSLDIMLWALRQHDPHGWLHADLQVQWAWVQACDSAFKHALDRYKYPNRYASEHQGECGEHAQATVNAQSQTEFALLHRSRAAEWLMTLQATLARQPCLCGNSAGLADMAILPFVRQFAHTDKLWFDQQNWPQLSLWLANWQASALFEVVMLNIPPWQAGQAAVCFPLDTTTP